VCPAPVVPDDDFTVRLGALLAASGARLRRPPNGLAVDFAADDAAPVHLAADHFAAVALAVHLGAEFLAPAALDGKTGYAQRAGGKASNANDFA
jgi:hypothetical protein